jgi:pyridoxal phosphate enzyme (YggS family)
MTAADWRTQLGENVAAVRARIAAGCTRAGRDPGDVCLVAVTKYVSPAVVDALLDLGVADIGESRAQQLAERATERPAPAFDWPADGPARPGPRWHMIGHLQRNKVRLLLPHARIVHSLDSERLAEALQRQAEAQDACVDALVEVNVSGEVSKEGLPPAAVTPLLAAAQAHDRLRLRGLMTMAPYDPDPERSRPVFQRLRALLEEVRPTAPSPAAFTHLSMGMSQDYEVAVEEGATLVRVGSALFEGLPTDDPR